MKKIFNLIKNTARAFGLSLKFSRWLTIILALSVIFVNVLPIYQSKIMGDLVNAVVEKVGSNTNYAILIKLVTIYALIWFVTNAISNLNLYLDKVWFRVTELHFSLMIAKKRTEIDIGHYEDTKFLNLMTKALMNDHWPIVNLLDAQFQTIGNIFTFVVTSVVASSLSWKIYAIIVISAIPTFIINIKYSTHMWSIWHDKGAKRRKYANLVKHTEDKSSVIQSKILQTSGKIINDIKEILLGFKKDQTRIDRENVFWSTISGLTLAIGVGIGFYMIILKVVNGEESIGSMVFLVGILGQLVGSVSSIVTMISKQFDHNLYVDDIFKFLDTKPFLALKENPIELNIKESPLVEFKDVWFKYQGNEKWILKNINLKINPGEKIAIVGMNGAGKTTFVKLLARIYDPERGQILVNGIDLRDIKPEDWSSSLGVLLQDYVSYDFKIGESIAMGRTSEEMNTEKVVDAAKRTSADIFIEEFNDKYDQQLGRDFDGVELSKGQQQKIALARMIYRDALITVLDEPTASIDALSETHIFDQMNKASKDRTLIVITHRFNTTKELDRIIVLENGEIVEDGSHEELIREGAIYKSMFDSQAKSFYKKEEQEEN